MSRTTVWHRREERGSMVGMRLTVWLYRRIGARITGLLLYLIVAYFFLTDRKGRRASLAYFQRLYEAPGGRQVLGTRPGWLHVFRHYLEFGISILDRVALWMGDRERFDLRIRGLGELQRIADEKRGALILGSHLGCFDVMRVVAEQSSPIVVHVLMFMRHADRINTIFRKLDELHGARQSRVRVLPIPPGGVEHVLEARACLHRGELIAILADRVPPSDVHRAARVTFLGAPALVPQGPVLLAGLLGCPVLLMTGVRLGKRHYEVQVERLADRVDLPRKARDEAVTAFCQTYVDRLEKLCLRVPYQWFNFFDFWSQEPADARV